MFTLCLRLCPSAEPDGEAGAVVANEHDQGAARASNPFQAVNLAVDSLELEIDRFPAEIAYRWYRRHEKSSPLSGPARPQRVAPASVPVLIATKCMTNQGVTIGNFRCPGGCGSMGTGRISNKRRTARSGHGVGESSGCRRITYINQ